MHILIVKSEMPQELIKMPKPFYFTTGDTDYSSTTVENEVLIVN